MNHTSKILFAAILFISSWPNTFAETITVTAKKILNSPKAINTNNNLMMKQQNRALETVLPGQLSNGSSQNMFARGLESYHTKMEIDGIEANDPSAPNKSFNFNFAPTLYNGKLQYLGAESSIYSNTLSPSTLAYNTELEQNNDNKLSFIAGSYGQNQFVASVSDKTVKQGPVLKNYSYNLLANLNETEGRDLSEKGGDKDGFNKKDLHIVSEARLIKTNLKIVGHFYDYKESLDGNLDANGKYTEDPNRVLKSNINLFGIFANTDLSQDITHKISYSKNITKRKETNGPDIFNNSFGSVQIYEGTDNWIKNSLVLESEDLDLFLEGQYNFGVESSSTKTEWQNFETRLNKQQFGLKGQKNIGNAYIFAGNNILKREDTKSAQNFTVGPGIRFGEYINVEAQIGRSEVVPSLFQLTAPAYGNKNLNNEVVKTKSLSIGLKKGNNLFKITRFENDITNRFSFDPITYQSINSGEASIKGLQAELKTNFKSLELSANSIYQEPIDRSTGKNLMRRSKLSSYTTVSYQISDSDTMNLSHSYKGKRLEFQGSLPSYNKWDIGFSHHFSEFTLAISVENILANNYRDSFEVLPSERTVVGSLVWKL